jgi:glycosyltransferase involved in cell wall biosynthesis
VPVDKEPLTLSLIIPAYNEENYLRGCIESIAKQSVKPDEVILVNNNSTDKTLEIAAEFDFVRVINEPKQGIVYARNRGFDAAKSDIIGRIDGDSRLPSDWVAQVKHFYADDAHQKSAITGGGYFYNIHHRPLHTLGLKYGND